MIPGLDLKLKKLLCSSCGSTITRKYYRSVDFKKVFCPSCYEEYSRCQVCNEPVIGPSTARGMNLCFDCYTAANKCSCCGTSLEFEKAFVVKGVHGFFCKKCFSSKYSCSFCKKPVQFPFKLTKIDDELSLCSSCVDFTIYEHDKAANILLNMRVLLKKLVGISVNGKLLLKLVSKKEMRTINGGIRSFKNKREVQPGLFKFTYEGKTIFMKKGMPIDRFISVLAHEYAHAWQHEHCKTELSSTIREGFAEWISTKILWLLGLQNQIGEIEDRTDIYGIGLRKIQSIETFRGVNGVVDYVLK